MNGGGHWMSGLDPHKLFFQKTRVVGCSFKMKREAAGPRKKE